MSPFPVTSLPELPTAALGCAFGDRAVPRGDRAVPWGDRAVLPTLGCPTTPVPPPRCPQSPPPAVLSQGCCRGRGPAVPRVQEQGTRWRLVALGGLAAVTRDKPGLSRGRLRGTSRGDRGWDLSPPACPEGGGSVPRRIVPSKCHRALSPGPPPGHPTRPCHPLLLGHTWLCVPCVPPCPNVPNAPHVPTCPQCPHPSGSHLTLS